MVLPLKNSITQKVTYKPENFPEFSLWIKREDLLHPHISGNKYRKLRYNLEKAKNENYKTLLSFGGAYSNHIAATAAAGYELGFKTIGVIRGDELGRDIEETLTQNPTLGFASSQGMQFKFVDRETYRLKHTEEVIQELKQEYGSFYLIPEGGTNALAVKGCQEILSEEDTIFDYICSAIGTGGTISGIINTAKPHQKVLGFPALKGDFLKNEINKYVNSQENWELVTDYHFGGFAKINAKLVHFINDFNKQTGVLLDPVYTGKMTFGLVEMYKQGYFKETDKILLIHSGGLQGIDGMNIRLALKNLPIIQTDEKFY